MNPSNRIRYVAGIMLAAEREGIQIYADRLGRVTINGKSDAVLTLKKTLSRYTSEISYLLNYSAFIAENIIANARARPSKTMKGEQR